MRVGKIGRKSFNFLYTVFDRNDRETIYATGESVQVCFDYDKNETLLVSEDLKRVLEKLYFGKRPMPPA